MMNHKIAILGGGISGLSLAYFLRQKHPKAHIDLYESAGRLGGAMQTLSQEGILFECGPRTFKKSRCEALLSLIDSLGLSHELISSDPKADERYIALEDKLYPLTLNPGQLLSNPLTRSLWRALMGECFQKKGREEESVWEFGCRRFGKTFTETILAPFMRGIYAGDSKELSALSTLPLLKEWEQRYGSLTRAFVSQKKRKKGPSGLATLKAGMVSLITALADKSDLSLHLGNKSAELPECDRLYVATGIGSLAHYLPKVSHSPFFKLIHGTPLITLNLAYTEAKKGLRGFGYLTCPSASTELLGVIFDSDIFPQQNHRGEMRLTVMLSDSALPDDALLQRVRQKLQTHLGIEGAPLTYHITRHSCGIPQIRVGYREELEKFAALMREHYPEIRWTGNYLVSPSVNQCIENARRVAELDS